MEQDKIDVARATPVNAARVRRGAPLWLQLLLSLIIVAAAAVVAGLYNAQANRLLAQVGLSLPLLTATAEPAAGQAPQQAQGGPRQGQGGAGGRPAGAGGRTAVVVAAPVGEGTINDKLARQALEGVLAGEGSPAEVVEARGLVVVSDDSSLEAAVDEALAAQPDVLEKIREGKVQAAGAIVGAVMKATRGQADAGRVREIILQRAGVEG